MIPVPDAIAAYDRVTHFTAQPGDVALLIEAAAQPGMPAQIVEIGNGCKANDDAYAAYTADMSEANASAYMAANEALRQMLTGHTDIPFA